MSNYSNHHNTELADALQVIADLQAELKLHRIDPETRAFAEGQTDRVIAAALAVLADTIQETAEQITAERRAGKGIAGDYIAGFIEVAEQQFHDIKAARTDYSALSRGITAEQLAEARAEERRGILLPYPLEWQSGAGESERRGLMLPRGAISVIVGQTGHGKTALCIDIARRAIQTAPDGNPARILYLTNEGTRLNIYNRFAGRAGGLTDTALCREYIEPGIFICNECHAYSDTSLIDGLRGVLRNRAARWDMVIIDWAQMVSAEDTKAAEHYRLRNFMSALNGVATDYRDTAFITAAQFNRQCTNPARVSIDHIGDAIGIAQLASKIIGVWNCNKPAQWGKAKLRDTAPPGYVDTQATADSGLYMAILKERHGNATHRATLLYNPRIAEVGGVRGGH